MMHEHNILNLLSYNIQVGIQTTRASQYITGSWKHLVPHSKRLLNLDKTAAMLGQFDIVGLQEVDAGSLRSNYINQTEYLADRGGFQYWYHQVNRNLGHIAQHSNGLLSQLRPFQVRDIRLQGLIPGRQAMIAEYGNGDSKLAVIILHLALSKRARLRQLAQVSELVNEYSYTILMGDLNCKSQSREMQLLFNRTNLCEPELELHTFPSWRPQHHIDHVLVTENLDVLEFDVLQHVCSDHLPIAMKVAVPNTIILDRIGEDMFQGKHDNPMMC